MMFIILNDKLTPYFTATKEHINSETHSSTLVQVVENVIPLKFSNKMLKDMVNPPIGISLSCSYVLSNLNV